MHASRVRRGLAASVTAAAVVLCAEGPARAGGFELPDNGAQALGRGATFVAKADDGTAIYYNPAGLARQRGTRLYVGGNLYLHSFEFQRSGAFPDDPNDPLTQWGQRPFPVVTNSAGPFFAPFLTASTDFASLDRLTVAVGAFGPPIVGNRTFPLAIRNAPASSRYDFVQSRSTIIYPTAAAAYRVTPWLDLGFSAHLVLANFDQTTVSYADVGQCKNVEYQPCDSTSTLVATATSFAGTIGALIRPSANVAFGLSVRTPVSLEATGVFTPGKPRNLDVNLAPGQAFLSTRLPLIVRAGGRYIAMDGDFELYDLELDATYEGWAAAQGDGPRIRIPSLGTFKNIDSLVVHGYADTFSVRVGGAYNLDAFDGIFTLRAGGFFDSAATSFTYTRVDFDTLTKIAGTFGLGYRHGALGLDLGYAAIASVPRLVGTGQGDVRPVNGAQGGKPVDNNGDLLPAVNEGAYRGFTHTFSVGLTVTFDELFGAPRPFHYGNAYEHGYVAPGDEEKPEKSEKPEKDADDPPKKPEKAPKKDLEKPPEAKPEKKPEKKPDKPLEKKKEWWEDLDN
ncbi:MAG: Long-chain fatty acid transport protein [Labilithrix sp.]|nr:Long-chain fatty acid transport protein [Labilithrix sp.]